jgi:hypothetical protein
MIFLLFCIAVTVFSGLYVLYIVRDMNPLFVLPFVCAPLSFVLVYAYYYSILLFIMI